MPSVGVARRRKRMTAAVEYPRDSRRSSKHSRATQGQQEAGGKTRLTLGENAARAIMEARHIQAPTRELPLNFAVPLVSAAILEEDDELQETWARMLVNASDASTNMELRTAYVEILRGMSAFDVKNLSGLAAATLALPPGAQRAVGVMKVLHPELVPPGKAAPEVPKDLAISLANLARLGCAMPGGGLDGSVLFSIMTVTQLGIGLYNACS